ncbi:MAG: hypothetical protein J0H68_04325 [Sphingobacteriia bacterium]|nr:hypothetical protein [Sphingobacteriia bacterium]
MFFFNKTLELEKDFYEKLNSDSSSEEYRTANKISELLSNYGSLESKFQVGKNYITGKGVKQNFEEGFKLLKDCLNCSETLLDFILENILLEKAYSLIIDLINLPNRIHESYVVVKKLAGLLGKKGHALGEFERGYIKFTYFGLINDNKQDVFAEGLKHIKHSIKLAFDSKNSLQQKILLDKIYSLGINLIYFVNNNNNNYSGDILSLYGTYGANLLELSAQKGHLLAQLNLSYYKIFGFNFTISTSSKIIIKTNHVEGMQLLKSVFASPEWEDNNNPILNVTNQILTHFFDLKNNNATEVYQKTNYENYCFIIYGLLAEKNDINALYYLGESYLLGIGTPIDFEKGYKNLKLFYNKINCYGSEEEKNQLSEVIYNLAIKVKTLYSLNANINLAQIASNNLLDLSSKLGHLQAKADLAISQMNSPFVQNIEDGFKNLTQIDIAKLYREGKRVELPKLTPTLLRNDIFQLPSKCLVRNTEYVKDFYKKCILLDLSQEGVNYDFIFSLFLEFAKYLEANNFLKEAEYYSCLHNFYTNLTNQNQYNIVKNINWVKIVHYYQSMLTEDDILGLEILAQCTELFKNLKNAYCLNALNDQITQAVKCRKGINGLKELVANKVLRAVEVGELSNIAFSARDEVHKLRKENDELKQRLKTIENILNLSSTNPNINNDQRNFRAQNEPTSFNNFFSEKINSGEEFTIYSTKD